MEYNPSHASLQLGDQAPYFSLPATDDKIYSISDFDESNALVVIFTSNHCPYAQAYEQRIAQLVEEFRDRSVSIVAICSNDGTLYPEDSFEQMVAKSKSLEFAYPYLQDASQQVAKAYSAVVTPECFVFNPERQLSYHGAFDNNYASAEDVTARYVADAIVAVLRNEAPPIRRTPIQGCSIKYRN